MTHFLESLPMKQTIGLLLFSLMPWGVGMNLGAAPAQAGETCNYINNNLFMAQAHQSRNQVWVSQGWWVIEPGNCVVYADTVSTFFKYNEDNPVGRQPLPNVSTIDLCVVNDRFTVYQANDAKVCDNQDGQMVTFVGIGSNREVLQANYDVPTPASGMTRGSASPNPAQFPLQGNFAY